MRIKNQLTLGASLGALVALSACGVQPTGEPAATVTVTAAPPTSSPSDIAMQRSSATPQGSSDSTKDRAFLQEVRLNDPLLTVESDADLVSEALLTCHAMDTGVSATDVAANLQYAGRAAGTSYQAQLQSAQMIGAGIRAYCPWNQQKVEAALQAARG